MSGLPTVPLCLKESLKVEKKIQKNKGNAHIQPVCILEEDGGGNSVEQLNTKMAELRDMDCHLFHQLWALYDSIQEHKQSYLDRLSETNSECSSVVSYSLDNQLETIPDFQEHVYVNEKFHQHIYENQSFHESQEPGSSISEKEENMYEPVYVEHDVAASSSRGRNSLDRKPRAVQKSSSRRSMTSSSNRSKRFSGVFPQTTYESSC